MQRLVAPGSHAILGFKPRSVALYGNISELLPFKDVKPVLPVLGGQDKYEQEVRYAGNCLGAKYLFLF
ncbi:MAG: hypothetical protein WA610_13885 [Thermodesulfovibrionales bacterium]